MNEAIEAYRQKQTALDSAVRTAVQAVFDQLAGLEPEKMRDRLITVVPPLVEQYGAVAAELATEFYAASLPVGSHFTPLPSLTIPDSSAEAIEEGIRYQAGKLFVDDVQGAAQGVASMASRHVRLYGRQTMVDNVHREGVGWARVPKGDKTCSFCLLLASRGAVYATRKGASTTKVGKDFHNDCDCEIVRMESGEQYPPGYLPDNYLEMYEHARNEAENPGDIKSILAQMRRLYPDTVTDGVVPS